MILARAEIWHDNLIDWPAGEVTKLFEKIRQEFIEIAEENEALLHIMNYTLNLKTPLYCCVVDYEGPVAIFSTLAKAISYAEKQGDIDAIEVWHLDDPKTFDAMVVWRPTKQ